MKNLIAILAAIILVWAAAAAGAADKVLTEGQLDGITAGTAGEGANQSLQGNYVSNSVDSAEVSQKIDSDNSDAISVVNIPNTIVDNSVDASQNVHSKNKVLVMKDKAQQNAKAVNISNSVESKVGAGVNIHVHGSLPGGSSGGSINNLYQSNTIINNY
jgi:hypothetical protein